MGMVLIGAGNTAYLPKNMLHRHSMCFFSGVELNYRNICMAC